MAFSCSEDHTMQSRTLLPSLATSALLLVACAPEDTPPPNASPIAAAEPTPASAAPALHTKLPLALRDTYGNPIRAQALRDDLRGSTKPAGPSSGATLGQFAPFYLALAQHPPDGSATHYELALGPEHGSRWFAAEELALFSSLVGALPLGELEIYADTESALRAARGEADVPVLARRAADATVRPCLWPVLEQRRVREVPGVDELWRVRCAARLASAESAAAPSPAPYRDDELASADAALRTLDCAIVLDCTGSMSPFWEAARSELRGITQALGKIAAGRGIAARFRLVAFRDHGSSFVTRGGSFGDEAQFLRELDALTPEEGGDAPEAALEALSEALRDGWSTSPLATRTLFLATDAPWHVTERADPAPIANRMGELGIAFHALLVGSLDGELGERRERQARELAQRSGGSAQSLSEAPQAVASLRSTLEQNAQRVRTRSAVLTSLRSVGTDAAALAESTKLPLEEVTEVLEFLGAGLELERFQKNAGRSGIGVFEGWIAPRRGKEQRAELRLLMSRPQLELLRESCRAVIADLSASAGRRAVMLAWFARAAPDQSCDEHTDLALFLSARLGVPCGPDSALRLSDAEIRHMGEQERLRRLDRVALSLSRIVHCERDSRLWFDAGDGVPMAFLPEEVLP
jgi:hypothetical protein